MIGQFKSIIMTTIQKTILTATVTVNEYFTETWPKALKKPKSICGR